MAKTDLTAARLREILNYDPQTGVFTWKARLATHVHAGDIAGSFNRGYLEIGIGGKAYAGHRLAWLYEFGCWPTKNIDHIDGNPGNNRICNLRDVSQSGNMQNLRRAQSNSTHGILGISKNGTNWAAQITAGGVKHYLGTYATQELAREAYLLAKRQIHSTCTI
ncbi:HNH endonuclease signature motif containing protein [Acidithiobacillus sp.]|uniref:HNH endonuclease signature motif containing protein n=1 Tax=Acidithiobacillus sp. TaxID=1872118 RepID=UPI0025886D50|nr:HNH endonuclease signature motif containing protein [Acidithiobacillus sp.]MDD5375277.1 HNH endonuclease signature motif containing protein [Acidithiobacillus sp.]